MTPPPSWRLLVHEALPSTSDLCRRMAEAGESEGLVILARRQTAGRGTQGRDWASPLGNLYMSVLLRPDAAIGAAPRHALMAAVVVADALAPLLPDPSRLRLKWPNDVLLDGGKLAGLLVEAADDGAGWIDWLTIGFGVNLATAPDLPGRSTACLGPEAPSPEVFAADLLSRLATWCSEPFCAVRDAWLSRGPTLGEPVRLRLGDHEHKGCFDGLGEDGRLLLRIGGVVRAFAAGEI